MILTLSIVLTPTIIAMLTYADMLEIDNKQIDHFQNAITQGGIRNANQIYVQCGQSFITCNVMSFNSSRGKVVYL